MVQWYFYLINKIILWFAFTKIWVIEEMVKYNIDLDKVPIGIVPL